MKRSLKVLCFSWNTDDTPLCEGYLPNRDSGKIDSELVKKHYDILGKRIPCYNPLFFEEIRGDIFFNKPDIVVITTENETEKGTYFHAEFLPRKMATEGYK